MKKEKANDETSSQTEQVTEQVRRLVDCLKEKPLSVKEIFVALNLKHRPTLMQDYIKPALWLFGISELPLSMEQLKSIEISNTGGECPCKML